jgi:hypothetical protein
MGSAHWKPHMSRKLIAMCRIYFTDRVTAATSPGVSISSCILHENNPEQNSFDDIIRNDLRKFGINSFV